MVTVQSLPSFSSDAERLYPALYLRSRRVRADARFEAKQLPSRASLGAACGRVLPEKEPVYTLDGVRLM